MIKTKFVIIIILAFLLASVSIAQSPRSPKRAHPLDLAEEQQLKVDKLQLEMKKEMLSLKTEMHQLQADLRMALISDDFKQSTIKNLITKMADVWEKMALKRALHKRQVRDLLTGEQRVKFDMHILSREHGIKKPEKRFMRHHEYITEDMPSPPHPEK